MVGREMGSNSRVARGGERFAPAGRLARIRPRGEIGRGKSLARHQEKRGAGIERRALHEREFARLRGVEHYEGTRGIGRSGSSVGGERPEGGDVAHGDGGDQARVRRG
jgi:hypothetical protein